MRNYIKWSPAILCGLIALGFILHGPIPQLDHYHEFADQSRLFSLDHASDVLSNLGFLWVALWAGSRLLAGLDVSNSRPALTVFVLSILATAWCSSYYHVAPDNARLFWDRLPIALACASLLAVVRAQCFVSTRVSKVELIALCSAALCSVLWWQATQDLRPYLLLQILAILLPPLWQALYQRPSLERLSFAAAIACYVIAKLCEMADAAILTMTGVVSGHTLKHLLAALAAYFILRPLLARQPQSQPQSQFHSQF